MKRVLLPTDFSENSFNAACYALALFQNETCVFYLMNTYTPPIYRVDYALGSPGQLGLPDDFQHFAMNNLKWFETELKKRFNNPRHSIVLHSAFNTLDDEIKRVANNEEIDIIVMGTHGATGAKELFFGSNTLHAIKKTVVPILAIPSKHKFKAPKNLLFPTDLEIGYCKVPLQILVGLSQLWQSTVHILHVTAPEGLNDVQRENKKTLEELISAPEVVYHDYPDQELLNAINGFYDTYPVEILAMVQNKHTFLERLFIEPIIKNIGLHSQIPFLVLPYQPDKTVPSKTQIDLNHSMKTDADLVLKENK